MTAEKIAFDIFKTPVRVDGLDTFLTNFGALYLTEFLTDFGQILDSKSYDQA